ncbi:hypothetical protein KUW17_21855 [Leisingera aquaemixtae]|uniref:sodium/calcium exchanger protein n=1 Tax=Leisingera aquaemixtae TaxID=1396826 RepID=UPI001C945263|nr:sodium/calcium exchanger protein [Leisingera aquaemixtae]MBY6069404.1 hypothetical protein [Leisingera aquaemixtae]
MPAPDALPVYGLAAVFAAAALVVWFAGTRLAMAGDELSGRYNLAREFAGLLFLATVTELPEIVTTATAAQVDTAQLVLGNMFGGITMQTAILAVAGIFAVRYALTSWPRKPNHALLVLLLVRQPAGAQLSIAAGILVTAIYVAGLLIRRTPGYSAQASIPGWCWPSTSAPSPPSTISADPRGPFSVKEYIARHDQLHETAWIGSRTKMQQRGFCEAVGRDVVHECRDGIAVRFAFQGDFFAKILPFFRGKRAGLHGKTGVFARRNAGWKRTGHGPNVHSTRSTTENSRGSASPPQKAWSSCAVLALRLPPRRLAGAAGYHAQPQSALAAADR